MTELAISTNQDTVAPIAVEDDFYLDDYTTTTDSTFAKGFDCKVHIKCRKLSKEQVRQLGRCEITRKMNDKLRRAEKAKEGTDLWQWRQEILSSKEFTYDTPEEISPVRTGAVSAKKAMDVIGAQLVGGTMSIEDVKALLKMAQDAQDALTPAVDPGVAMAHLAVKLAQQ